MFLWFLDNFVLDFLDKKLNFSRFLLLQKLNFSIINDRFQKGNLHMNLYTNKREAFIYASVCPETKQDRQADEKMKTISIFIVFDVEKFNFLWMNNIVHS